MKNCTNVQFFAPLRVETSQQALSPEFNPARNRSILCSQPSLQLVSTSVPVVGAGIKSCSPSPGAELQELSCAGQQQEAGTERWASCEHRDKLGAAALLDQAGEAEQCLGLAVSSLFLFLIFVLLKCV